MKTISREELKTKLDRGDNLKLYFTLGRRAFEYGHIPGSLHMENAAEEAARLAANEEIVVYCANPSCPASIRAYMTLQRLGHDNVYRYAGGLEDWQEAGYRLEGSFA